VSMNLAEVLQVALLVVQLTVLVVGVLILVRVVKVLLRALVKLTEELDRWEQPPPPTTYTTSVSTSAPSQAHPITGPTSNSESPPPEGAIQVTCKHCRAENYLVPIRSEVKGEKTILKFMCPGCSKEFGRLI